MIVVVTGLPRSGTSMMMQILQAGGLPVLMDETRVADASNPRGFLEDSRVRRLERDAAWLCAAEGHAIKVVSPLLQFLPSEFEYRVLFLRRSLSEVLQSQAEMLRRSGREPGVDDARMKADFERHLAGVDRWLSGQRHMKALDCQHRSLISAPALQVQRIAEFLALPLDCERMAAAIDPSLHRQRAP